MKKTLILLLSVMAWMPSWSQTEHNFSVAKNLDVFNSIYRQLDLFYVDSLEAEKIIRIGIDAMLAELDPYTMYFPEEDMSDLKLMTTGKYGGIGSIIRQREDSTVIVYEPYPDMPAAEVGLQVGDVMLKIDDKDLKGLSTAEVSELLRGEPGTTFVLRVQRPGEKKARDFKITRRSIKKTAIPYYGLRGNVGYISLNEFTEGCSKDVRKAVITLKEKGAASIVIDLRNNGGGLLNEAVEIVNLFVPQGVKILETKGKIRAASTSYTTQNEPLDLDIPLAILVDGSSASASEIVAGSLQDLDRAVIVGDKTFGKGLVQSPRDLPYNGSLKLTTAKYYIPSGRCIQAIDYQQRRKDAETYRTTGKKAEKRDSLKTLFRTAGGREVTEGSGIMPDVAAPQHLAGNTSFYPYAVSGRFVNNSNDTILSTILIYLSTDDVLIDWGTRYFQQHPTIPAIKDFVITDADYEEFKSMVKDSGFKYDRMSEARFKALKQTAELEGYYEEAKAEFDALEKKLTHNLDLEMDRKRDDIRKLMAQEVVKRYSYQSGKIEESLKGDAQLEKAITLLGDLDEYHKLLGK